MRSFESQWRQQDLSARSCVTLTHLNLNLCQRTLDGIVVLIGRRYSMLIKYAKSKASVCVCALWQIGAKLLTLALLLRMVILVWALKPLCANFTLATFLSCCAQMELTTWNVWHMKSFSTRDALNLQAVARQLYPVVTWLLFHWLIYTHG